MTDRDLLLTIYAQIGAHLMQRPPVEPPPPPPPKPPSAIDYSRWSGMTRAQLEAAYFGPWPNPRWPAGWNWEDAYASGHVLTPEDYGAGSAAVDEWHFAWEQVGHYKRVQFQAGLVRSFSTDVPPGFSGVLRGNLGECPGSPDTMKIRLWFSLSPNGPAIPGSEYEGGYLSNFAVSPEFRPPSGRVYFNVLLKDKSGPLDVKLTH